MTVPQDTFEWGEARERLRAGKLMPVMSNKVVLDLLFHDGFYDDLIRRCAEIVYEYKLDTGHLSNFGESGDGVLGELDNLLARSAQHYMVHHDWKGALTKTQYLTYMKNQLLQEVMESYTELGKIDKGQADRLLPPDLREKLIETDVAQYPSVADLVMRECSYGALIDHDAHPLCKLLDLNIPIFLTTGFFQFLEAALDRLKRPAKPMVYCWNDRLVREVNGAHQRVVTDWTPSFRNPLVYHFYGLDEYPSSLVLTEDDHLEFVENWSSNFKDPKRTPEFVRSAICNDAYPVLLGYDLNSWELRAIWRIIREHKDAEYGGCAIQLDPRRLGDNGETAAKALSEYLRLFFKNAKLDIVWATPSGFIDSLSAPARNKR